MTKQDLLNNGYSEYNYSNDNSYDFLYQKRVKDESGLTLYFINVELWKFSKYGGKDRWVLNVSLYLGLSQIDSFAIKASIDDCSVTWIEGFVAETYKKMGCVPDMDNND